MVFTRSLYEGEFCYDLRKWVVKQEFDKDVDKFITLVFPTKAGQSIKPAQLAKFFEQIDDTMKAVQEAKKHKHYEARFSLGGGLMFTVSSKPYFKCQFCPGTYLSLFTKIELIQDILMAIKMIYAHLIS